MRFSVILPLLLGVPARADSPEECVEVGIAKKSKSDFAAAIDECACASIFAGSAQLSKGRPS